MRGALSSPLDLPGGGVEARIGLHISVQRSITVSVLTQMYSWYRGNEIVLVGLGILSVIMFIATLLAVPLIVARIPTTYFIRKHQPSPRQPRSSARMLWLVLKNILGIFLLLGGLAMLVLPGQGVLTILLGIMLMNFPGKYELERYIIQQPTVLRAVNWMRLRANRPALIVELPHSTDEAIR
jgi:hypothetical protein